ncbi:MAG: hypothetical protein O3A10_14730 [Chloroflexi bacterium]|nr:hypothetical protein [Chloroflexota bacterium]MDA1147696.1 hypothetical protein [Chloroflexota bacterium]
MPDTHQHKFHFTREPDVLHMTARALDWPDRVPEKIVAVELCDCGELKDIEWMAHDSRGSIPGWMARRFRDYFDHEAERASPR